MYPQKEKSRSYLNYNKIYPKDKRCSTINYVDSNKTPNFDAEAFAAWFMEGYRESSFKSLSEVGDKTGIHRSTIARYARAGDNAGGKPSKPTPVNVKKIADLFKLDVNKGLMLAGHAPLPLDDADDGDIERIEIEAMYRKRKKLTTQANKDAFRRILAMVDKELDRMYEDENMK